ncbi:helix-turn-helix transcriptional regulator [Acidothermaceae bacterium B102]|nr:helix-turn-helix transcriptional regulator [Acidothermaceae bacterium B102]
MSVRLGLLALLDESDMYGYQLRATFEQRTGATWPLNIGQVYTTLNRLERDGLVEESGDDGEGHQTYRITEAGRAEVHRWFVTPVSRTAAPRDELAIKLALAVQARDLDVTTIIATQRTETLRTLQDYTRLKAKVDPSDPGEVAWLLVLDAMVFQAEAEVRWLDLCDSRLSRLRDHAPVQPAPVDAHAPRTEGVQR